MAPLVDPTKIQRELMQLAWDEVLAFHWAQTVVNHYNTMPWFSNMTFQQRNPFVEVVSNPDTASTTPTSTPADNTRSKKPQASTDNTDSGSTRKPSALPHTTTLGDVITQYPMTPPPELLQSTDPKYRTSVLTVYEHIAAVGLAMLPQLFTPRTVEMLQLELRKISSASPGQKLQHMRQCIIHMGQFPSMHALYSNILSYRRSAHTSIHEHYNKVAEYRRMAHDLIQKVHQDKAADLFVEIFLNQCTTAELKAISLQRKDRVSYSMESIAGEIEKHHHTLQTLKHRKLNASTLAYLHKSTLYRSTDISSHDTQQTTQDQRKSGNKNAASKSHKPQTNQASSNSRQRKSTKQPPICWACNATHPKGQHTMTFDSYRASRDAAIHNIAALSASELKQHILTLGFTTDECYTQAEPLLQWRRKNDVDHVNCCYKCGSTDADHKYKSCRSATTALVALARLLCYNKLRPALGGNSNGKAFPIFTIGPQPARTLADVVLPVITPTGTVHIPTIIDTGCTYTTAHPDLLAPLDSKLDIIPASTVTLAGASGSSLTFSQPGVLIIEHPWGTQRIIAYGHSRVLKQLPQNSRILLSNTDTMNLAVDVAYHQLHPAAALRRHTLALPTASQAPPHMLQVNNQHIPITASTARHDSLQHVITEQGLQLVVPRTRVHTTPRPAHLMEIFSGPEARLTTATRALGLHALAPIDIIHSATHDLRKADVLRQVVHTIATHLPRVVFLAPPCTPYSVALRNFNKHRPGYIAHRIQEAQPLRLAVLSLIRAVLKHKLHFMIENPASSSLWDTSEFDKIQAACTTAQRPLHRSTFDMCRYSDEPPDAPRAKKPTTLWTTLPPSLTSSLTKRCSGHHTHQLLRGRNSNGVALTKVAATYPHTLASTLAHVINRVTSHTPTDNILMVTPMLSSTNTTACTSIAQDHLDGWCYLSQKLLRKYLSFKRPEEHTLTWQDIHYPPIGDNPLLKKWIPKFKALAQRNATVFHVPSNGYIKPVKWPPLKFEFHPDSTPYFEREPRYSPAEHTILSDWARKHITSGMYTVAHGSRWAGRTHITVKHVPGEPKDLSRAKTFKLRICHDEREKNKRIIKCVSAYPNPIDSINKAAGHSLYISLDLAAMFNGFELADDETRDVLAVWVPEYGLIKPTRLIFGTTNASSYCQQAIRDMEASHLAQDTRDHKIGYQDDSCIFAGSGKPTDADFQQLYHRFEDYIKMCVHYNLTIKPTKTFIGFSRAVFYGHELSIDGHQHSARNIQACVNMQVPKNAGDVRSITATFAQAKNRVPHFATTIRPLHDLLRKGTPFRWTHIEQQAFTNIRNAIINQPILYTPDYTKTTELDVDASDEGMGVAYKQKDTHGNYRIISWYSKAWKPTMQRRPIFYREAAAVFYGLHLIRFHAAGCHKPIIVHTDQISLKWAKHSDKGLVTSWRLHLAHEIDFRIQYKPGLTNVLADALSRAPMLTPSTLTAEGNAAYLRILLSRLPAELSTVRTVRLIAKHHEHVLVPIVQSHFSCARIFKSRQRHDKPADFTILILPPERTPMITRELLRTKQQSAILMPSDLTPEVYTIDNTIDAELQSKISQAAAISILSATLVWLVINVETTPIILLQTSERMQWINATEASLTHEYPKAAQRTCFYRDSDGLAIYRPDTSSSAPDRVYVPLHRPNDHAPFDSSWRHALIQRSHSDNGHLSAKIILQDLQHTYFWPRMRRDIEHIITRCSSCTRAKATRNLAHGHFKVNEPHPIRTRWSLDFANHGQGHILTCIDVDANYVEYKFTTTRAATTVRDCIESIFLRHGFPDIVSFDDAPEFTGTIFTAFLKHHDIKPIHSGGYHPTANARIERNHRYLNEALRIVNDADYAVPRIHLTLLTLARAWNNHVSDATGTSAAQLYCGTQIRTSLHTVTRAQSSTPPLSAPAATNLAHDIAAAIKAQEALARVSRIFQQQRSMHKLNGQRAPASFEVGATVIAYQPLASIHTQRAQKHNMQFSYPLRVTDRLSDSMYKLEDPVSKRTFQRHISTLRAHTDDPLPTQYTPTLTRLQIGTTIATMDPSGDYAGGILIGTVVDINDSEYTVHHYGSRTHDLQRATFRLVYTDKRGRVSFAGTKSFNPHSDTPWTTTYKLDLTCIVAMNLTFRDAYHLSHDATTHLQSILERRAIKLLRP
jgi:transposase InsO family protein